jgi:hypothetical protein
MRLKNVFGILLSLFTLVIVGCGGGGSSSPGGTAVSGSAAKGPITGGTVQAFEIISSASAPRANIPRIGTTVIATGTTAADGSFTLTIPPSLIKGGVLFKLTGGSYKDEATGATVQVNAQAANGLRAAFSNISGIARRGDTLTVNITPYTELGVQTLGATAPTDAAIKAANAKVVTTFGLTGVDILTTKPFDATTAPPAGATQAQKDYALALAVLSQSQKGATLDSLFTSLLPDVNAGALSPTNSAAANVALLNFLNSGKNLSGGTVAQPATVTIAPSATTAAINTTVTITATVKQGAVNVPNGTLVTFTTTNSASGTLTTVSGTTTNGVATATLTSAVDTAAFVVTATAGGQSASTATITFANPTKPGAIVLTKNPASGVTNGQGPVTITATVSAAGGAGFTVPTGTVVNFSAPGGTLTNVTTTNASGVATATLNSSAVSAGISVSATAGTAPVVTSNTISVPFIAQPTLVTVKVATTGTLPANTRIGGINAIVTANPATGLTIADADVTASGVAATGVLLTPNTTNVASVNLALVSTGGILVGEFVTLQYHVAAGTFPVAGNFSVALTGAGVIDTASVNIPGIGVSILSVTVQ